MQEARVKIALAILGSLALGGGGIALYSARHAAPPPVVITPPPSDTSAPPNTPAPTAPDTPPTRIYVDVSGAVRRPWLYALPAGSRVMRAVLAAGGPAPGADLDAVNLAEPLRDGEKVYIPVKQPKVAVSVPTAPPGNIIGYAPAAPPTVTASAPPAPALPTVIEPGATDTTFGATTGKHRGSGKGDKLTSPDQGQVALNTADLAQLERLPGVGPAMAARILAFRDQAHGFQSISELQEVGGIGPKKFAKIAPLVTLN